jgi:4-phytase/acid phosphatase
MNVWPLILSCLLPLCGASQTHTASAPPTGADTRATLQYVVVLSRHGVRSPTAAPEKYSAYARGAWPKWTVPPGDLTPHGFQLMQLFGAYDRILLAQDGLLSATGCDDTSSIRIYADSDERTIETGKALARGLMPGCALAVASRPQGVQDPLFHPELSPIHGSNAGQTATASLLAKAAIAGRLGGDPANLALAYAQQLNALDHILATCGEATTPASRRISLLDIPASLTTGTGDHLADLKGPLSTASTLAEDLLLEYAEGMDGAQVGWGCVHRSDLTWIMSLHTAATDFTERTPVIAGLQAAPLLTAIGRSIEQKTENRPVAGALGAPSDRVLILVGHDTNIENIAGALRLSWIIDGRRDDTPPGGALVFELWRAPGAATAFVRTYYTAQTLDQMRHATVLSGSRPPDRVPVFLPGCSQADGACPLPGFLHLLRESTK